MGILQIPIPSYTGISRIHLCGLFWSSKTGIWQPSFFFWTSQCSGDPPLSIFILFFFTWAPLVLKRFHIDPTWQDLVSNWLYFPQMEVSHWQDNNIPFFMAPIWFFWKYGIFERMNCLWLWAVEYTVDVSFETQWEVLLMGSCLCVEFKRGNEPLPAEKIMVQSPQNKLPACKSISWILKLSIMGSHHRICVEVFIQCDHTITFFEPPICYIGNTKAFKGWILCSCELQNILRIS